MESNTICICYYYFDKQLIFAAFSDNQIFAKLPAILNMARKYKDVMLYENIPRSLKFCALTSMQIPGQRGIRYFC